MAQGKAYTKEQREVIIESLRDYLELGFSRNKACDLTGLEPSTLSRWVTDDEALAMKLQSWENAINKLALANIRDAIQKEGELEETRKETTKWWIERKMKNDFSTRIENTGADGKDLPTPILGTYVSTNNITQENISNDTQDTNSSRGDISVQDDINTPMVDTVSTDGQDANTDISSSGINTTLETRSDERLQEHNAITPILERL